MNSKGKKILSTYEYAYDSENKVIEEKSRKQGEKAKIATFTYDKGGQLRLSGRKWRKENEDHICL